MTTVARALSDATAMLAGSSDSPRADAVLLLERALGRTREWLLSHGESRLSAQTAAQFLASCEVRGSGMPVAYVLGSAGFYGREFVVNRDVLIPRPQTEHLIDETLAFLKDRALRVLDVGAGSGAIACTIAAQTPADVAGTDASRAAVGVATQNARRLGVAERCRFYCGDLLEPVAGRRFDCVIANLPYVPTGDLPEPPNPASFEPREALDGGPDGLALYRRLLAGLAPRLEPGALVLLEAAPPTILGVRDLLETAFPEFAIAVGRDYAGLGRYVTARAPDTR